MTPPENDRRRVAVADDLEGVARLGADLFVRLTAQHQGPIFRVALSGGSTPRVLHALLATPLRDEVDWTRIAFYWGDDRCVPPDHPDSNYKMARDTLLSLVPVRDDQIHRMRTELPPAQAADAYERELRRTFDVGEGALPRFDLIFLGMGPDGHTLSLFPHTEALRVTDRLVVANHVAKLNADRVTITYPVANNAAAIAFLVAGADKADALAQVLEGPRDVEEYPAQGIAPTDGALHWFVDRAAAANLRRAE